MRILRIVRWLPEGALLCAFLFFALRDIGSFPAAWADDSLFMLVARMIAEGRGYVLPILGYDWPHPYILAVGPTLIYPVALFIKLFGFSVAAARMPMTLFLFATIVTSYLIVRRIFDRTAARWNAAFLISFSAFINTGKPVLGEVPGVFFLLLGLFLMAKGPRSAWSACAAGAAFGLAVVTKLPCGLIFPALAAAWIVALVRRDTEERKYLTIAGTAALAVCAAGAYWLGALDPGFFREIWLFLFEKSAVAVSFESIYSRPIELLRLPYGHYVLMSILGAIGWWQSRRTLGRSERIILAMTAVLYALYFLNGPGWYRALLPSTLLLFLFVPAAARTLPGKRMGSALLLCVILLQGIWQFRHRGASASPEALIAAGVLEERWKNTPMVIAQAEVFVRLSSDARWLYFSDEMRDSRRQPSAIQRKIEETRCLPILRRVSRKDSDTPKPGTRRVSGRYFLFDPPADCRP